MASIISSGTTSGTALNMTADTSGALQLATGASATTAITLDTSQNATFAGKVTSAGSLTLASNGSTTAVTIDTSQNVGIGTTSPATKLQISGTSGSLNTRINAGNTGLDVTNTDATGVTDLATSPLGAGGKAMTFTTYTGSASAERMRIDSSGNVLVGTTSSVGGKISCVNSGDAIVGQVLVNNNYSTYLGKNLSGTTTFVVSGTGQISAAFTTIISTSDQRLKENITNLDVGLDAVMALKPRKFDWKAGKGKDIKGDRGFIAQEFEQVFPDLVSISKYDVPKDEEPYKTISVDIMPVLVKAIQEQQTIINDLKARIEALEAK